MVVKGANHPEAEQFDDLLGLLITVRVELAISANPLFSVIPGTVATRHTDSMTWASFALAALLSQTQPQTREITFKDGLFTINGPEGQTKVSIKPGFEPMNTQTGRLWIPVAGHVLTFDDKGVGFRKANRATYATYSSIATSDKIFTKEQADQINRDVAAEKKTLEVSAVSGWEKVGDSVYAILRWDDKQKKPWLEVLMRFDFPNGKPRATYLGRFDSMTFATGRVNDKLIAENGKLICVTHGAQSSLLESFDMATGLFEKKAFGTKFSDAKLIEGSLFGMGLERTPASTTIVSLLDREKAKATPAAEIRGGILGLYAPALLHYGDRSRQRLLNLETGAELELPVGCGIEAIDAGILLWTPKAAPTAAALYSPVSFRTLTRWQK